MKYEKELLTTWKHGLKYNTFYLQSLTNRTNLFERISAARNASEYFELDRLLCKYENYC